MALEVEGLKALSYSNGFTLWHLKTEDISVEAPGYLDAVAHMLSQNDVVIVELGGGGENGVVMHSVLANEDGKVRISAAVDLSQAPA